MSFSLRVVIRITFLFCFIALETRINADCPDDLNGLLTCLAAELVSTQPANICSVSKVSALTAKLSFITANSDICYQVTYTTDNDTNSVSQNLMAEPADSDNLVYINGNIVRKNYAPLTNLTPESEYTAEICWSKYTVRDTLNCKRCCDVSFNTSSIAAEQENHNELRVQVFSPLLNISSAVSAQVILNPPNNVTIFDPNIWYNVRVFENNVDDEAVFEVLINETVVNIINTTAVNQEISSVYPLTRGTQYTVQVRATNGTHYPFPTVSRNFTAETESQTGAEFVVLDDDNLWLYNNEQQKLKSLISGISQPIAFDKLNRVIFYFNASSHSINHLTFTSSAIYDSLLFQLKQTWDSVTAMTYDWISEKLYFIVRSNAQSQLYSLTVDETEGHLEMITNTFNNEVKQMIIDPISGLIYWTQKSIADKMSLSSFNLSSKVLKRNIDTGLKIGPLALDVRSGCVYCIKVKTDEEETNSNDENSECCVFEEENGDSDVFKLITIGERGVFILTDSSLTYYRDNGTSSVLRSGLDFSMYNPISFDATSPGTQPLPELPCLSPVIAQPVNLTVSQYSDTWFLIEWNPDFEHRSNCKTRPFSFPLVTYQVTVFRNGLNEPPEYDCTTSVASVNVSGVNNPYSSYRVRLRPMTDYSNTYDDNDDDEDNEYNVTIPIFTTDTTSLSSSVQSSTVESISEGTTVTSQAMTPPSFSITETPINRPTDTLSISPSFFNAPPPPGTGPGDGEGSSSDSTAVAAGVGVGVGLVILILVGIIMVLSLVLCLRSKKSYRTNSNSARYVKSNGMNNSGPRYVSQEISVPEQSSANAVQYESPVTLSNHSLLNSGQSSSNTSVTFAQYATPADSLEDYRTQTQTNNGHHPVPPNKPTPYAVPADSLQQYRSSQIVGSPEKHPPGINTLPTQPYAVPVDTLKVYKSDIQRDGSGSLGQEYEVPLSLSQQSTGMTPPTLDTGTTSPTGNLYSTVDDAKAQKQQFTNNGRVTNATPNDPPSYTSLQPSRDEPHSYTTSTGITEASQLYSEPISSSPKKMAKRTSQSATLPLNGKPSHSGAMVTKPFDNPVYGFEPEERPSPHQTGGGAHDHTYSVLNRKTSTDNPQPIRSHSHTENTDYSKIERKESVPSKKTEPMYFELENSDFKRKLSEPHDTNKNSNPASSDYHQLDRSMVTRTHSNPHSKPSAYHQLQRPNLSSMKLLPHSKPNGHKISDPTYQVLEKPDSHSNMETNPDSQSPNPEPMYSVLEDNRSKPNDDPDSVTTKPEPTYFELEKPATPPLQ